MKTFAWQVENGNSAGQTEMVNLSKEGQNSNENKTGSLSKEGPSKPGNCPKEGPNKQGNSSKEGPSKPGNPSNEGPSKPGNSLSDARNKAGNPSYGNVTTNRKKIVFESLKVIGIILLLLVLLTGPFVVLMFMTVFNFEPPLIYIPVFVGLAGLNSALNPLVYGWRIEVLRKEFKRLFVCKTER
jgi:hypothetical protein